MRASGNIRKMKSTLNKKVSYTLPLFDVLNPKEEIELNQFIGKTIAIRFENEINCVVTGEKINKTFGDGMSFKAFKSSPLAVESIIRPELSQIHLGIALRDKAWEEAHHNQPHVTYLSYTSGLKVGVTRTTQIPTRWIDQGATQAIILAETPYRQAAGLIEVALKSKIADKTHWQKMLTQTEFQHPNIINTKDELKQFIPSDLQEFISKEDRIIDIVYPMLNVPQKVKSIKLDTTPVIEKKLMGIKGQYLIFDDNTVINLRSHTAYKITFEA